MLTHEQRQDRRLRAATGIKAGKTVAEVAKETGLTVGAIRAACHEFDVEFPTQANPDRKIKKLEVIAALQNSTKTQSEVAREFGVLRQFVHAVYTQAKQAGIKFPKRKD